MASSPTYWCTPPQGQTQEGARGTLLRTFSDPQQSSAGRYLHTTPSPARHASAIIHYLPPHLPPRYIFPKLEKMHRLRIIPSQSVHVSRVSGGVGQGGAGRGGAGPSHSLPALRTPVTPVLQALTSVPADQQLSVTGRSASVDPQPLPVDCQPPDGEAPTAISPPNKDISCPQQKTATDVSHSEKTAVGGGGAHRTFFLVNMRTALPSLYGPFGVQTYKTGKR